MFVSASIGVKGWALRLREHAAPDRKRLPTPRPAP